MDPETAGTRGLPCVSQCALVATERRRDERQQDPAAENPDKVLDVVREEGEAGATADAVGAKQLDVLPVQSQQEEAEPLNAQTPRTILDVSHSPVMIEDCMGKVASSQQPSTTLQNLDVHLDMQLMDTTCTASMKPQEVEAYEKLKKFCSSLVKKLAPPLLKEIQASELRPNAEPFTPRRNTRAMKRAETKLPRASPAENALMTALGLMPQDLNVNDDTIAELQQLFDSPLRQQHVRVIAALFGKVLPTRAELEKDTTVVVSAH